MKFLGVDFGTKKVGIATSDDGGTLAFPLRVIKNDKNLVGEVLKIAKKESVERIVIGRSLNYKQEENKIMEEVRVFKKALEVVFSGEIYFQNETLSSKEAGNIQVKDDNLDARAAAIILQSYIDQRGADK